jgi:hypothetical protein
MHVETASVVSFLGGLAVGAVLAVALYETTRTRRRNGHAERSRLSLLGSEGLRNGEDKSGNEDLDIYKDEVLVEMFTRNIQFFGAEKQAAVSRSFVVIVGLGVRPFFLRRLLLERRLDCSVESTHCCRLFLISIKAS